MFKNKKHSIYRYTKKYQRLYKNKLTKTKTEYYKNECTIKQKNKYNENETNT